MRAGTASAAAGPISPSTSATNRRTYTLSSLSAAMRAGIAFNPISSSPNFCTVGRTRLLLRILVCKSLLQKLNLMQRLLQRWGFVVCEHRLRARSSTVDQKPGSARAGPSGRRAAKRSSASSSQAPVGRGRSFRAWGGGSSSGPHGAKLGKGSARVSFRVACQLCFAPTFEKKSGILRRPARSDKSLSKGLNVSVRG
jgi:hypothetical protein